MEICFSSLLLYNNGQMKSPLVWLETLFKIKKNSTYLTAAIMYKIEYSSLLDYWLIDYWLSW